MLTAFTALFYVIFRLSGSAVLGYLFLIWTAVVGIVDIFYIVKKYFIDNN